MEHPIIFSFLAILSISWATSLGMPGGWSLLDIDQPGAKDQVKEIANYAAQSIDEKENSACKTEILDIKEVKTQVVSGVNYKIVLVTGVGEVLEGKDASACETKTTKLCTVVVWDQAWTNSRSMSHHSCKAQDTTKQGNNLLGGEREADVGDARMLEAVKFYTDEYNRRINSMYRSVASDVHATEKVVTGMMISMTLQMSPSVCRNNDQSIGLGLSECPLHSDHNVNQIAKTCEVKVWDRPWLKPRFNLIKDACKDKPVPTLYNTKDVNQTKAEQEETERRSMFKSFRQKYRKLYLTKAEEKRRYGIFRENLKVIDSLNAKEQGSAVYKVNEFADLSPEEFRRWYLTPRWDQSTDARLQKAVIPQGAPPAAWDWRDKNVVTPIKNQGQCGSCWAFSTTGNVEGQWAMAKGKLLSLSEQELVDCDKLDEGCNGGLPSNAYEAIQKLGGLEREKDYPYDGADDRCTFEMSDVRVYINGSLNISSNEAEMAGWLVRNGPISIGINAMAMQFYSSGVSHPLSILCDPESLDHGVLIVGYGVENGWFHEKPYWIIKNSWGESWGEKGYYRVYRGGGTCGVNRMATSALIK